MSKASDFAAFYKQRPVFEPKPGNFKVDDSGNLQTLTFGELILTSEEAIALGHWLLQTFTCEQCEGSRIYASGVCDACRKCEY